VDTSGIGTGVFTRWQPYGDGREVIVRRESELGRRSGPPGPRRSITVDGTEVVLETLQQLLSPPPLQPGQAPMSREAAAHYTPTSEIALLPGTELLIRRHPGGFSDAEVEEIVAAFVRAA
jgi:hypothetical protein